MKEEGLKHPEIKVSIHVESQKKKSIIHVHKNHPLLRFILKTTADKLESWNLGYDYNTPQSTVLDVRQMDAL
jgi:hypothetical protein